MCCSNCTIDPPPPFPPAPYTPPSPHRVLFEDPNSELGPLKVRKDADGVCVFRLDLADNGHQLPRAGKQQQQQSRRQTVEGARSIVVVIIIALVAVTAIATVVVRTTQREARHRRIHVCTPKHTSKLLLVRFRSLRAAPHAAGRLGSSGADQRFTPLSEAQHLGIDQAIPSPPPTLSLSCRE